MGRSEQPWQGRRLHFVGIGGCGMSGLALVARSLGATVTGSDRADTVVLARLRDHGIEAAVGHRAAQVPEAGELVYSSAISKDNPALSRGRELGLRVWRRGELLAEVSRLRRCIAVAGTHGKSTTAAMVVLALRGAGIPAGYVIGADLLDTGVNAEWGPGEWLVIEADESDRSLLELSPEIAVLTNVEMEHVLSFGSLEEIEDVFAAFLSRARHHVVWDRPRVRGLAGPEASYFDAPEPRLGRGTSHFYWAGHEVSLPVPGEHNARNAAAALEACRLAGADPAQAASALSDYGGTARRLQRLGRTPGGSEIYDDYAHHPSEVRATLSAARTLSPERLVAVFEPHSFARVRLMAAEFGTALALADSVVVLDVLRAGPRDREPVSSTVLVEAVGAAGCADVTAVPDHDAAVPHLARALGSGDICVSMGIRGDHLARRLVAGAETADRGVRVLSTADGRGP